MQYTGIHRLINNFSVFMRVRGVCTWVLLHKPSNPSKARYFLHCFWSPFKEMNAKWNYMLEIINFTYNSWTKEDFQSFENIFGKKKSDTDCRWPCWQALSVVNQELKFRSLCPILYRRYQSMYRGYPQQQPANILISRRRREEYFDLLVIFHWKWHYF